MERSTQYLRHVVLLQFKATATDTAIASIEQQFVQLKDAISCVQALEWGLNNSPEGLSKGFTHCFFLTFASEEDRDAYLPHPAHQAFVEQLKPLLEDVLVVDYWAH